MKKVIILSMMIGFSLAGFAQKADSTKTTKITLRGVAAYCNEALIIIDGNKQYLRGLSSLNEVNPDNIESVSILKDSLATARYGADGFAGVIDVKTKTGALSNNYAPKAAPIEMNKSDLKGKVSGFSVRPSIPNINTHKEVRYLLNRDFDPKAKPLYVVDGKEVTNPNINEKSIKSVVVIKDASSQKIYGDKGKNGVIMTTTKNAASQKN
ncbi:TonB-dependent outer membrane receptor, SusC/RagA subfamily, signature region [Pedobacter terrae]|uniref:TonB-dependent outer membrane receptor, SusC/RagA subfamily, signature region n=1 Tax=Pedobacter terrae TaxID=405671 RepID=A0A1G8AMN9_9SPHI|nr:TonB-dependent receptor plug domain-containing protein [Pedobacter terrae]SDH22187.1 TonB-dependent outer membrane receptor, SusC/RagA subfamily, signature region [Pedobacter terrae]